MSENGSTVSRPGGGGQLRSAGISVADTPLDAAGIVAKLNEHRVEYVVIGAYAAIAYQAPIPATRDIDNP